MKRNHRSRSYRSPLLLWSDLALKTTEMMLASAQVIGHRTARIAAAGAAPSARDRREFALMGSEKLEAGARSGQAMATYLMTMNPLWGAQAVRNMMHTTVAVMALAGSRTPAQMVARQAALARALGQTAVGVLDVSHGATRLAQRGLKPVHAKATANAKRLGRR